MAFQFENEKIFNLQLAYWIRAKLVYKEIIKYENPREDLIALVITDLCLSLVTLSGVQLEEKDVPDLIKLWGEIMPQKGYVLRSIQNGWLFETLEEMNIIYENISKHFTSYYKRKNLVLKYLSKENLKKYFENTRQIWLWFLDEFHKKKGVNYIPEDQLVHFK